MCIVPKRCNDMMNVGRLQGFDVGKISLHNIASQTFLLGFFHKPQYILLECYVRDLHKVGKGNGLQHMCTQKKICERGLNVNVH